MIKRIKQLFGGKDVAAETISKKENIMRAVHTEMLNGRGVRFYPPMPGSKAKTLWVNVDDLLNALHSGGFGDNSQIINAISVNIQRNHPTERAIVVEDGTAYTLANASIAISEFDKINKESPSTAVSTVSNIVRGTVDRALGALKQPA